MRLVWAAMQGLLAFIGAIEAGKGLGLSPVLAAGIGMLALVAVYALASAPREAGPAPQAKVNWYAVWMLLGVAVVVAMFLVLVAAVIALFSSGKAFNYAGLARF